MNERLGVVKYYPAKDTYSEQWVHLKTVDEGYRLEVTLDGNNFKSIIDFTASEIAHMYNLVCNHKGKEI